MKNRLETHIDALFAEAPDTGKVRELKEEMLQNLTDKYNDLIAEGKTADEAYSIATASIGDVTELLHSVEGVDRALTLQERQRAAILQTVAVSLYILCVVPILLLQSELGVVVMFVMIAAATGLLVYNNTSSRTTRSDRGDEKPVRDETPAARERRAVKKSIVSALWLIAVAVYLYLSFKSGAWHITWLVYPIAGAASSLIDAIFSLKEWEEFK